MNCRLPGVSGYAFTTGSPLAVNVDDNKDRSPCYHLPRSAIAGVGPGCPHRTALSSQGGLRSHLVPHVTGAYRRAGLAFVLRLRLVSPLSEPARRVAYSAIASRVMQCLSVGADTSQLCISAPAWVLVKRPTSRCQQHPGMKRAAMQAGDPEPDVGHAALASSRGFSGTAKGPGLSRAR
jgi:hypothetical protein